MKIRFVARKSLQDFKEGYKSEGEQLLLFGFEGLGAVSYEKELKGESVCFEDTALLSKEACAIVVSGCVTEMGGIKRKSAVVAERGKLLGVSDVTYTIDGHGNPGGALRVYDTKLGRMGVLVAEDLFFSDTTQALSLCGSDFLVCIYGKVEDSTPQILTRSYAYLYGLPIFFCGIGYSMIADMGGSLYLASPKTPLLVDFDGRKEYHVIQTRRRGRCGST